MNKGINFLYEEYKKNPERVEKLLNGVIEISEKLDGSRFLVQTRAGKELIYFKRRDAVITKIDRTLSKYYEKAVFHFENLPEDKIAQLPDGWRFGMEYFPNLKPVTIAYDKLPLNNLVLTDIQVKDPKDRTVEIISDKETLEEWANILEVECPPIFFNGELSTSQKNKILDFLNTPYSDLITRFKTESFTSFILKILNPELSSSFLNNDLDKDIDGLLFRFDGKEAFRVSNPEITLQKQEKREDKPSDIYNLTLVFLQEFLTSLDFKKIKLKSESFEARYIDFISQVYNRFLQTPNYKNNFESGVDFELPHFLTREESGVNFKFVTNKETLAYLDNSNTNRELFKILMASMRSHKKKASGFFTKDLIAHHNKLVDDIADYIGGENIKESTSFCTFQEFKAVYLTETENWQQEFGKESPDDIEHLDFIEKPKQPILLSDVPGSKSEEDDIEWDGVSDITDEEPEHVELSKNIILDVLDKFSEPDDEKPKTKTIKVCLLKGKFHPFHNGHVSIIKDAAKESGMKVILAVNTKGEKSMSHELHSKILDEAIYGSKDIHSYVFTTALSMSQLAKSFPSNIEICAFAGSKEECEDVNLQLGKNFKTITTTKHINSNSIIDKIKDEDYAGYKKLVPSSIHNYFYKIKNELK